MRTHQTKNTSVQIVAISLTSSSMSSTEIGFWTNFAVDRSISRKANYKLAMRSVLSREISKAGSQPLNENNRGLAPIVSDPIDTDNYLFFISSAITEMASKSFDSGLVPHVLSL